MDAATRVEALRKLDALSVKIGYPNRWRDYSQLRITAADLIGDVARSRAFDWSEKVRLYGGAVDRSIWAMAPQEINAYNNPSFNEVVFPAGLLQAPFFDPAADLAVNYGAIGAIIGHEITHGFDDQGRRADANGQLRDWWTPADGSQFEARANKLADQFDAYEVVPGVHVQGKATLGENIADAGGLAIALDAYHAALGGRSAALIDGTTGDQRFFLGWAQAWRVKTRDEAARKQVVSDFHSPERFRVDAVVRNMDAWYDAFHVQPTDKLYLPPSERARIW
jgi:putative endopeptidase